MKYRLADFGRIFSTRDRGAEMRRDALERLSGAPVTSLIIDLDGVLSVSYSFVDEYIGELTEMSGGHAPSFANMSPLAARTISSSLANRGFEIPPEVAAQIARRRRVRAGQHRHASSQTEQA
jgi:hypothetical protein